MDSGVAGGASQTTSCRLVMIHNPSRRGALRSPISSPFLLVRQGRHSGTATPATTDFNHSERPLLAKCHRHLKRTTMHFPGTYNEGTAQTRSSLKDPRPRSRVGPMEVMMCLICHQRQPHKQRVNKRHRARHLLHKPRPRLVLAVELRL
jgi:hypothetical protein